MLLDRDLLHKLESLELRSSGLLKHLIYTYYRGLLLQICCCVYYLLGEILIQIMVSDITDSIWVCAKALDTVFSIQSVTSFNPC